MSKPRFASQDVPVCEPLEPRTLLSAAGFGEGVITAAAHPHGPPAMICPLVPGATTSIVDQLATVTPAVIPTIPANGDVNPYGTAFVPDTFPRGGPLQPGDLLISNFNASSGLQGTGTTIVRITPDGTLTTFFQGQPGLGLTTALGILNRGYIIVGNMPTTDGTSATVQPGSLLVINRFGQQVLEIKDPNLINGPWDLTIRGQGARAQVFVSNVLTGTVTRVDLLANPQMVKVLDMVQIASGYTHRPDPAALELGPTGLAFDQRTGTLFVASTADNEIFAVPNAATTMSDNGTGQVAVNDQTHLHGPLGMVLAPNGDLIVANGDAVNADPTQPSEIVEFTQSGQFVSQFSIDSNEDAPFGIALSFDPNDKVVHFAAVNDNVNMVNIWELPSLTQGPGKTPPGKVHH